MEKVMITKKQAEAIEIIKGKIEDPSLGGVWESVASVLGYRLSGSEFGFTRTAANELSDGDFVAALTVGYTVEANPAEDLADLQKEVQDLRKAMNRQMQHRGGGSIWTRTVDRTQNRS